MPKILLPFVEYLRRQIQEILSPENKWFAGEKLHHSPSDQEAAQHYAENGGAEHFAERFEPEFCKHKEESEGTTTPPA